MQKNEITLQASRNGLSVPVVDGVYLHSIYNPSKEAHAYAENHESVIQSKSNILIFGLGFGYHVEEVAKIANKAHKNYTIYVIEPNAELVKLFSEKRPFLDKNIKIITGNSPEEIYTNYNFSKFLITKPGILKLDTSFNVNKKFFTDFLTYKASHNINNYQSLLNANAQEIIAGRTETFHDSIQSIKKQRVITNKNDFLMLAIAEMARTDNGVTQ